MRYLIVITVLLGIGYSQCNESNWQDYYNSEGHNMEGCDLEGAYLQNENLSGANLTGANLSYANLSYAILSEANLSYAILYEAILYGANLTMADFTDANLSGANLSGANLTGANLSYVYLSQVNLTGVNLCNLTGSPSGDICEESGGITDENGDGYDDASYDAGVASVDITVDNQASYDEGYGVGYDAGVASVDSSAIYDSGYADGVASVDITVDNQASYDSGYAAGLLLSTQIVISVTEGWNMISSLPNSVNVDDIQDPNGVIPTNGIYGYEDGSYTAPSVLSPGEGYWLRALGDGDITLNSSNNG